MDKEKTHEHAEHHKPKHEHKEHHKEHHKPKHEHKEDHKHKEHHKPKHHSKQNNLFTYATIILGILFIASLMTNGFSGNSIDGCIDNLNTIKEKSPELAGIADVGVAALQSLKSEMGKTTTTKKPIEKDYDGEQVKVDFYVMSQCPYGTQVEDGIAPVLEQLGDAVDFNLDFIATKLADGTFNSLHGQPEVDGNIAQLCAIKYNPDSYMDMIVCMNKDAGSIPDNWKKCAQDNNLDVSNIETCYNGDEGKLLHSDSIKRSDEVGASGSPTIYLNDELYSGGRSETDFLRAICQAFDNAPEVCSNIPEPVKVDLLILTDERCAECTPSGLISQLTSIFPGLEAEVVDYNTDEGKTLYEETEVQFLPAFFFTDTVEEGEGYENVQPYLTETGNYQMLIINAAFDPESEFYCDNGEDDNNDGKVDCEDDNCVDAFECREEKEEHLQVFIMSDCPYGRKAIEALKPVVDNFEDITYEVHYIASETDTGFSSLHGQYEVDEDIIQLCVNKHSSEVWFDYLYCRSTNGVKDIDWGTCATETNVDITKVQACFDGEEGKNLLKEDLKIAESLGIGSSPTWIANNRHQFSGIDAETVKTNYCTQNLALEGCENTLDTDTGGVPSGSC